MISTYKGVLCTLLILAILGVCTMQNEVNEKAILIFGGLGS